MEKVIVFGTGEFAEKIMPRVKEEYEIICFIDNDIKKHNTYFCETYQILSLQSIKSIIFDKVLIASVNYASDMFSQLLMLGVSEERIIVDYVSQIQNIYVKDLFDAQYDIIGSFNRADILVKYMVIQSYYAGNDVAFEKYKKMQSLRLGISLKEAEKQLEKFLKLIKSIAQGYHNEEVDCIICDEKFHIMDGAHRLACCIYFGIPFIKVKRIPKVFMCNFGKTWFLENGFDPTEIKQIEKCYIGIRNENYFLGVIWPPARIYLEQIIGDLYSIKEILGIESIQLKHCQCNSMSEFTNIARAVYRPDDIASWKIEAKLRHMDWHGQDICILFFKVKNPRYRVKASSGQPISSVVEEMKKIIRKRYMNHVADYYYDNIFHVADNYLQSDYVKKVFEMDLDISNCFEALKDKQYVLTKVEVPYMTEEFPESFPIGKDADILCLPEEFEDIVSRIWNFAKNYGSKYQLQVRKCIIKKEKHILIRIEYIKLLIFQFDISAELEFLKSKFLYDGISERILKKKYYILLERYECLVRILELYLHPEKEHHKSYLMSKMKQIRVNDLNEYVDINEVHKIKEFIKEWNQ